MKIELTEAETKLVTKVLEAVWFEPKGGELRNEVIAKATKGRSRVLARVLRKLAGMA